MNNTNRVLEGRTALVTGSGGGIGRDTALALAAAGARLVVTVRRKHTGDETVAMIEKDGGTALAVQADAASYAEMEAAVAAGVKAFGGLDIVVHNANNPVSAMPVAMEDITEADWDAQGDIALGGAFICAKVAYPHLKKSGHGRYVVLASAFGVHGAAMNPVYSALKGSDRAFVKSLSREWGPDGITVNAICPAALTPPTETFFAQNPAVRDKYLLNFPRRRLGHPREIGEAVVAISSDFFGFVSAQTIQIDGGMYTAI